MFKLRKNIFETNSSSIHSVAMYCETNTRTKSIFVDDLNNSYLRETDFDNLNLSYYDPDNKILYVNIDDVDTGWGPFICDTAELKFIYLLIKALNDCDCYDLHDMNKKLLNDDFSSDLSYLIKFAHDYYINSLNQKIDFNHIQLKANYNTYPVIDHQSYDIIPSEINRLEISPEDFILEDKYIICVSNDNK